MEREPAQRQPECVGGDTDRADRVVTGAAADEHRSANDYRRERQARAVGPWLGIRVGDAGRACEYRRDDETHRLV